MNLPRFVAIEQVFPNRAIPNIPQHVRNELSNAGIASRIPKGGRVSIESGFFKMMAIGVGKFAGARQYHTFGYRLGLERVIRSIGSKVLSSGKLLGGLAIQEGAHHETAGLVAINASQGAEAMLAQEEALLREVKSWRATLPAPEFDVLIVDEIGKNISGAGMDTKVIN